MLNKLNNLPFKYLTKKNLTFNKYLFNSKFYFSTTTSKAEYELKWKQKVASFSDKWRIVSEENSEK